MSTTPEGLVKKKVKRILDELGIYHFSPAMNGFGRSGIPDIVCCVQGHFVGIECKAGSNRPTALQLRELRAIAAAGGTTFVINEDLVEDLWRALILIRDAGNLKAMMQ